MSNKTNILLATAVGAALLAGAQTASAHDKTNAAAGAIEARMKAMEEQLNAMKAEVARVRTEAATASRVADLEKKVAAKPAESSSKKKSNMVFFRGGAAFMTDARQDAQASGGKNGIGLPKGNPFNISSGRSNDDGYYVGAGLDFSLSDNLFGLSNMAEVAAELMFDWKDFGTAHNNVSQLIAQGGSGGLAGGPYSLNGKANISQFTLSASPKLKLFPGSKLRPWIIPFGLSLNVISPPSNGVTVLNPGLMTGVGVDYQIIDNIYAGVDFRYNVTGDSLNYKGTLIGANGQNTTVKFKGVNTDGYTGGAYLGIGF